MGNGGTPFLPAKEHVSSRTFPGQKGSTPIAHQEGTNMGKTLYLDCSSGISGDMCVAALLDLGASEEGLRAALATLPVADEFNMAVSRVSRNGLSALDFDVQLDAAHENHDHDMGWLFGHLEGTNPEDSHDHDHLHHHDHGHDHEHAHHHDHRTLADVTAIIEASQLSDGAKRRALAIFSKLAEAEATVHGATPETVHFHEVGATDSIVDICSVAFCLDDLGITDIIVPSLSEGHGTIRCAHGIMPIPVPAVVALCQRNGIALGHTPVTGELVTPTGAAIVAALRTSSSLPARYRILATGTGAGKRAYMGCSEVLRAMLIEPVGNEGHDGEPPHQVVKLETDIDDCTGEALGYTIQLLLEAGAREAHAIPLVMKKGRPSWQLEVVCDEADEERLCSLIFENTTTIGIRSTGMRRMALPRHAGSVETPYGTVATKVVTLPDGSKRTYPEYDSVVDACRRCGASFQDVFCAALQ